MEMGRRDRGTKKQSGSAKSKKVTLKKLNSSSHYYYEFSSSDLENEVCRKKKKTKILKKNFKDSNGVVHASVPRKLRSAMKKRNLESVSKLSSKRLNRSKTVESCLIKKEDQEMEGEGIVGEFISKDEKEVAETLYSLAGMFTETEKTCESLSNEKETKKVDTNIVVETDFTKDEMPLEQSDKQRSSTGMVDFIDRLKQSSFVNAIDSSSARDMETKFATSDTDYKTNGLVLWPGLSSTVQSSSQVLSKPSLSAKLPPWMDQAVFPPSKNASLLSKPLQIQPRKLKKCASHIYISRLIKVLQNSSTSLSQTEQQPSEVSERVLLPNPVNTITDFKSMISTPPKRYQTPQMLNINRTHNQQQEKDMTPLALDLYGPTQKQSYDFLSLSSSATSHSHFQLPQYLSPSTSSHQVQQISPYLPSRYQTAYNANQQQQQQLQKRLWAAAHYRQTNGNTAQSYSKPNLSLNLTSIQQQQPLHVATSLQRYNTQQQQHRFRAAMSMSHHHHHNNNPSRTVVNRQEHRFPLIYEDTRTPLQLLCNEQA